MDEAADELYRDEAAFQSTFQAHLKRIRGTLSQRVTEGSAERQGFEKRTRTLFKQPFTLFDAVYIELRSVGRAVFKEQWPAAREEEDYVFAVLIRLFGRALLTASEIRALLVSGHGAGAMARWRTMYELLVVSSFVHRLGAPIAERYYYHDRILFLKLEEAHQKLKAELGAPSDESAADLRLRQQRDALVAKYGREITATYGWASPAILSPKTGQPNPDPKFVDIEKAVREEGNLKVLKSWYRYASHAIHADAFGDTHSIQNPFPDHTVVAGPSQAGLGDVAALTLRVLLSITSYFAQVRTKGLTSRVIGLMAVDQLIFEMAELFEKIETSLLKNNPDGLNWQK